MSRAQDVVPDAIEPLSGYRMWTYGSISWRAGLHAMNCLGAGDCPWERLDRGWAWASCRLDGTHDAPEDSCSCGIYALPTLPAVVREVLPLIGSGFPIVAGRVELAGKIIEHERGFRAQRARIAELITIEEPTPELMRLGAYRSLQLSRSVPETTALSEIEVEAVELVAKGATTREIAASLGISPNQARNHLDVVMTRLGASARGLFLRNMPPPDIAA
jgi:DNA-binding CsgD family transcriptional regulator